MRYKLAIDMCYFFPNHGGGKDEVAYNLLRGFETIGVSNQVVCFAYKKLVPIISKINPHVKICVVPKIRTYKFFQRFHFWFRGYFEELWALKNNVGMILMPNKPSPNRKYRIPTMEILHDIEVFEIDNIPGIQYTKKQERTLKHAISCDMRNRDCIIAISDFDKNEMLKFFPEVKNKIVRIYDPIRFGDMKSEKEQTEKKYITALNIQHYHKNVKTIIKAFTRISKDTNYDLMLVGNLPENFVELESIISENHLENRVFFSGFVSDNKLNEIIELTRIYVNASSFEGFGMTAIEMMGKKIPTIVAESTAMPEVTMGLCRYYSPPEDDSALALEIMNEIKNPITKDRLEYIAQSVRDAYSYSKIAQEYWDLVQRLYHKNK